MNTSQWLDVDESLEFTLISSQFRDFNLVIERGDDYSLYDFSDVTNLILQARDEEGTLLLDLSKSGGKITLIYEGTAVNVLCPASEMDIPAGFYKYDFIMIHPTDGTITLMKGDFIVRPSITQLPA